MFEPRSVSHSNFYTRMGSLLVWGCNVILFMHGSFFTIRPIHLIGRECLHSEKSRTKTKLWLLKNVQIPIPLGRVGNFWNQVVCGWWAVLYCLLGAVFWNYSGFLRYAKQSHSEKNTYFIKQICLSGNLLFKVFVLHISIFGATDRPVLDFWWHLLWVSKSEWAVLFALGRGVCDVHSLRFTHGVTLLPVYMASIMASHFPHMCVSAEVGWLIRTADLLLGSQLH